MHENGKITKGASCWSTAFHYDGFTLPAQGEYKAYCKKWFSKGCNNTRQHPDNLHYAEHTLKSCKMAGHVQNVLKIGLTNKLTVQLKDVMKYLENKQYNFRHIVLSPPLKAKDLQLQILKKMAR